MNLPKIIELAEKSKGPIDMGQYANKRAQWAYDPTYSHEHMWWGKEQPYYKFLYLLTKEYPGMYVEVGTHRGIGFACAAAGVHASNNPDWRYAVGIDKDNHGDAIEVEKTFKRAKFINGMSTDKSTVDTLKKICDETGLTISIMFVDARHTMADANSELKTYKPFYGSQVLWVFDDIILKDNNTHLPLMFERLPGQKAVFQDLHTDNCVAVSLVSRAEYEAWDPGTYTPEELERGFRKDEAKGRLHHERY
jgi:cephalosporin hydroxylase